MEVLTAVPVESKKPSLVKGIFIALLLIVLLGIAAYAAFLFLDKNRAPISLSGIQEQEDDGVITSFDECFNTPGTKVTYSKTKGAPAKCETEAGVEFTESTQAAIDRFTPSLTAYGPVENWDVYTDPEKRFSFRYPSGRYELVTKVEFWNESAVALQEKERPSEYYAFAVETPDSRDTAERRHKGYAGSKIFESNGQVFVPVIITKTDPYLETILESFKVL